MTKCTKNVWETNTRGAYHSHKRQEDPVVWEAGNGLWRVVEARDSNRKWRLDRRVDGSWQRHRAGYNSDELLALAARVDRQEGVPDRLPDLGCWKNTEEPV